MMKFVADSMLGRLAKWMRVLGIDTHYQPVYSHQELDRLIAQQRILITRNKKAAEDYPGAILVKANHVKEQLQELKKEGFIPAPVKPFGLCLRCNNPLQEADLAMAKPFVPDYVLVNNIGKMKYCSLCRRFYWPGTHRLRMEAQLKAWGLL